MSDVSQPLLELGGAPDAPPLHIAPANGFPPETYVPLLRPFMNAYRVLNLPPRALWPGHPLPPPVRDISGDWRGLADDLLAGLDRYALHDLILVGHSFGGVASLLAVLRQPERFRALILLDPTLLPETTLQMLQAARDQNALEQVPLVQKALHRRRHFESAEAAYERLRSRSLFAQWSDEALRRYVAAGTVPTEQGVTLRWAPEWEAHYFATVVTDIWDDIPALDGLLPTLVLQGGTTDTFVDASAERMRALLPHATHQAIAGHGHLFPQSAPEATAQVMRAWLLSVL